jgi:adenylate kinase
LRRECLNGPHISTGDMLRRHIEAQDAIGLEVRGLMKAGRLVPDELVNSLVEARIQQPDCEDGFILDGYPRTVNQAAAFLQFAALYSIAPSVVHLMVDYERIVARLSGRRQCPICGTLYSLKTNPSRVQGICDLDGAPLVTRDDDREPVIPERLRQYELETRPILEYFRRAGVAVYEIQGQDAAPDAIVKTICDKLAESSRAAK